MNTQCGEYLAQAVNAQHVVGQPGLGTDMSHVGVTTLTGILRSARWRLSLPHSDPHPILLWITKGHSRVTAAARTRGLGPFSAVFIPAGLPWSLDPGPHLQATLTRLPLHGAAMFPERARILRVRELDRQIELTGMVEAINNPGTGPGADRVQLGQSILLSAWMDRQSPSVRRSAPDRANQLAADFASTVEYCFRDGLSLAQIGARMGLTATHLTRTLKSTCGQTAANYLTDRVMHEARCRLADSGDSAAEISRGLGFSSPAYFSRAFAAHAGVTPGAFRAPRQDSDRKSA